MTVAAIVTEDKSTNVPISSFGGDSLVFTASNDPYSVNDEKPSQIPGSRDVDEEIASIQNVKGTMGWFSGALLLTQGSMGTGVLVMPFAMSLTGYILAPILLFVSALLTSVTLTMYARSIHAVGGRANTFGSVFEASFPTLFFVPDTMVILVCIAVAVSMLIIVGDVLPLVAIYFFELATGNEDAGVWADRRLYIAIAWVCIGIPLSLPSKIASLRYASVLSLAAVAVTVILSFMYFLQPSSYWDPCQHTTENCKGTVVAFNWDLRSIMEALPIFAFAFGCHVYLVGIYNELKHQSVSNMNRVVFSAVPVVFLMYCLSAVFGYLTFGSNTSSNIITNFPPNVATSVAGMGMSLSVCLLYPLLIHSARNSVLKLSTRLRAAWARQTQEVNATEGPNAVMYYCTTALLLATTFGIALVVTDLGLVFEIVGATLVTTEIFILPGMMYIKRCYGQKKLSFVDKVYYSLAWFSIVFGCIFMSVALAYIFIL